MLGGALSLARGYRLALRVVIVRSNGDVGLLLTWKWEVHMRYLFVWVVEFTKFLGGRRLHPLLTQCPICRQTVRLHSRFSMSAFGAFQHAQSMSAFWGSGNAIENTGLFSQPSRRTYGWPCNRRKGPRARPETRMGEPRERPSVDNG